MGLLNLSYEGEVRTKRNNDTGIILSGYKGKLATNVEPEDGNIETCRRDSRMDDCGHGRRRQTPAAAAPEW